VELGGYRLLRTIGVGSRAQVFLAHPIREDADLTPVVVKVYGQAVRDEWVFAEIEALSRASGDHVVGLLDVTSAPGGAPALILTRHASGSLARLLGDRAPLEAGEAITILAPLATALARMHAAGVAHGSVGPGAVLFDATGAPALACFGRATLFAPGLPPARLETEPAALTDALAFASLAATVLERAGATGLAERARAEAAPGGWLGRFAEQLFDLAEPMPVDLRPSPEEAVTPARAMVPVLPPVHIRDEVEQPAWQSYLDRARTTLRSVRRPVWIVAAATLAALVVAFVAVPRGTAAVVQPSASPRPEVARVDTGAVTGDDPVAAARVLLQTREGCIRELSLECLDDVAQRGSAALEADRQLVRDILDGGAQVTLPSTEAADLVQRLGDSALVSLGPDSEPASVLLVKGEAGWRIRDYLEE
jgi:hypothetical protein